MTATPHLITPTIGRKVWFWPNGSHIGVPGQAQPQHQDPRQAMDATIVLVHSDRMVNLTVLDHAGTPWPVTSVTLQQHGDEVQPGMYAQWMPYQAGQAKKDAAIAGYSDAVTKMAEQSKKIMTAQMQANVGSKTATDTKCAQGSTAGQVNHADNSLRADLIRLLVGSVGRELANSPDKAAELGKGVVAMVDAMLKPAPECAAPVVTPADLQITEDMVTRFLGWKLPQDFFPDCYIAFDRDKASSATWPTGTNLLHAAQARAMLEHVLAPHDLAKPAKLNPERLEKSVAAGELQIIPARLTPAHIEDCIASEHYFTAADGVGRANKGTTSLCGKNPECLERLTFCVLVLRNGAKAVGINYGHMEAALHSKERGQTEARAMALEKVWELENYLLREHAQHPIATPAQPKKDGSA